MIIDYGPSVQLENEVISVKKMVLIKMVTDT